MQTRYSRQVREMEARIVGPAGSCRPEQRRAAMDAVPLGDAAMDAYLDRVRRRAYTVTDDEVASLTAAGWSGDQVFELTIAAAYGEGKRLLDGGLAALQRALIRRPVSNLEAGD